LQNGLYITTEDIIISRSKKAFQTKSHPTADLIALFAAIRGSPAKRVPDGQMYLQNHGSPAPAKLERNVGRIITNKANTIYFKYLRYLSIGLRYGPFTSFWRGRGIL